MKASQIRVLLVEDNKGDYILTRELLSEVESAQFDLLWATTYEAALEILEGNGVDVVLVDYRLGAYDGLDLVREATARGCKVPFILLTGFGSYELDVVAMEMGVTEYLTKGQINAPLLERSIRYAIERKRTEAALQQRNQELELLNRASQALSSTLDLNQVYATILEEVRDLLNVVASSIWLIDPETNELVCRQAAGPKSEIVLGWRLPPGEGIAGWVAQHGESLIVPDTQDDERHFKDVDRATGLGLRSILSVPLRVKQDVIGVLQLVDTGVGRFDRADLTLAELLAASAATAIENAQLYEEAQQEIVERKRAEEVLQRYAERLGTLHAIDGAILAAWSAEETAQAALRHIRQLVPCQGAGIAMFDFEAQEAIMFALQADAEVAMGIDIGTRFPMGTFADIEALRQGKVHIAEDTLTLSEPSSAIQALQAVGMRSYIVMPLIAHGELIGCLALGAEQVGAFSPEHVDILREIANHVAVALRQAHLRAALEAEEQRLAALVAHLPEGIVLLDDERRILLANPAAENYLSALANAGIGDVLTHLDGRPMEELLQPHPERLWHELEIAGPPRRVFETVAQPMVREGRPGGWILLIRDVTEVREFQQHLQQQDRLAAVGQLAAGIAHDFNNLLTTIMLYAHMLLRKKDMPADVAPIAETILGESRRAAELVQQVLDFSRRSPIETHPVDLKPFTREAVHILERTIPETIRLVMNVGLGEHVVNADPTRIQQVLMNVVVNARDAMPEGGELRIGLERVEIGPGDTPPVADMPAGSWVCLSVSDTGIGIPPDVLPRIFEPFFTTKPRGKGTGLGLAQVYGIVQQHAGYIDVDTEVGKGTTFRIYLPAYQVEEKEGLEKQASAALEGKGETILLVEDEESLRKVAQEVLGSLGYQVLTAADGREALEIYRTAERVDLVITDVVMPEMGGKRLLQELRKETPDLKALVITGYAIQEDLQGLKQPGGFVDVIYKPLDMGALAQAVHNALSAD
jgi:two-component system cell cycle sensor histidine kinase/response regulator CckA